MQGPPEMGNHGAQPLAVQDPAGKIAKFLLHAAELASQSRSTRSRRAFTAKIGLVMGDNVVELGQTTRLAMPLSSSSVMNMTPLALPGRWRTSTIPAASSQR